MSSQQSKALLLTTVDSALVKKLSASYIQCGWARNTGLSCVLSSHVLMVYCSSENVVTILDCLQSKLSLASYTQKVGYPLAPLQTSLLSRQGIISIYLISESIPDAFLRLALFLTASGLRSPEVRVIVVSTIFSGRSKKNKVLFLSGPKWSD